MTHPGIEFRGASLRIHVQWRGKRVRIKSHLDATKPAQVTQAIKLRQQMLREIRAGTFNPADYHAQAMTRRIDGSDVPPAGTSFETITDEYLKGLSNLAHSTQQKYRQAAIFWKKQFAGVTSGEITFLKVRSVVEEKAWESAKTRNNMLSVLRGVLQFAVDSKLLAENPAAALKNKKVQKPVPDPLNASELNQVLAFMGAEHPPAVTNYFEFMFFTGLRPEEAIALRVTDVFIDSPGVMDCIHVSKAFTAGKEKPTKTHCVRDVLLNDRSKKAVLRQLELARAIGLEHLFFNPNTRAAWGSEKFQRILYWYPALEACNIRRRVAYQTRHTFASLSLTAGVQPLWLADQMGHSTPKMVFDRYARWVRGHSNSQEHHKIEGMFGQQARPKPVPRQRKNGKST